MRKKITSLLTLLLMAVSVMAQVETNRLFTSTCVRGTWQYRESKLHATSTLDATDAKQQFALITWGANQYLWSQDGDGFLNNAGVAVAITSASPISYDKQGDGTYRFYFTDASDKNINHNGTDIAIDWWSAADDGNKQNIAYVDGIDMDYINSKIPSIVTVTWNITGVASTTLQTEVVYGEVPTLPASVPAYVTLTPATALVAVTEATTIAATSSYNSNMPFLLGGENYYTLKMNRDPALDIYVDPTDNSKINTKTNAITVADQEYYKWQFDGDWVNGFTLKNKATQSYVSYGSANPVSKFTAVLTDTPAEGAYFDLIQNGGKNYLKIHGSTNNAYVSNNGGAGTTFLTNWNSANNIGDAGAQILIAEAEELTEEATITYTYKYNGQVMGTEVFNTFTGRDMPAPTKLPYGVNADLPSGVITGTQSYDVVCTLAGDAPFQYAEDFASAKWYTLTIRGSKYPAYNSSTGHVANGAKPATLSKNDIFAFVGNPWSLKIINGGMGEDKALGCTYGNNTKFESVDLANGMQFQLENNGGKFVFVCMNGETKRAGHINDVNSELGIWDNGASATDGGSALTFEPVDDAIAAALLANPDWAALEAAINNSYATGNRIGDGLNQYNSTEYQNAISAGQAMLDAQTASIDEVDAAISAINTAIANLPINQPKTGSFLRIRSVKAGMGRVVAEASTAHDGCMAVATGFPVTSIFYYDGTTLTSYANGLKAIKNGSGSGFFGLGEVGAEGTTIEFMKSTVQVGTYNVRYAGNRYLYAADNATNTDAGGNPANNGYSFWLEEVTSLPVAVSAAGYSTLYAPVALTVPAGVKAYTLAVNGDYLTATEVSTIAANTGVIIEAAEGSYEFAIAESADAQTSCLNGTVATQVAPAGCYTLADGEDGIGFYSYTGTTVKGFKAYYENTTVPDVKGFAISFNEADAIMAVKAAKAGNVYDLSGRKVVKAQKGIFIQNGKKVVK